MAIAYDAAGNSRESDVVTVFVSNPVQADTTPFTVFIASPSDGSSVGGNVTVTAVATDNTKVTKVKFFVDGLLRSVVTSSTNTYSWNWNTRREIDGLHVNIAEAVDGSGNTATASVTVQKKGFVRSNRSGK